MSCTVAQPKGQQPSRKAGILCFLFWSSLQDQFSTEVSLTHSLRACWEIPALYSQTMPALTGCECKWLQKESKARREEERKASFKFSCFTSTNRLLPSGLWIPATASQSLRPKTGQKNTPLQSWPHSACPPATQHQIHFGNSVCWLLIKYVYQLLPPGLPLLWLTE